MPTKGSCLKLMRSGSSIHKVRRMTLITPSKVEFLVFLYYTSAGLLRIRSFNSRSTCQPGKHYWPFTRGARRLNNGYYVLKLKNTQWWFQHSSMILMVGLIVLMCSSRISNKWTRCILYLLERLLDQPISCWRMLHWAASIAYGLYIIMLLLDWMLIWLHWQIQVYSCEIVYRIVLFDIDIIYYHFQRVWYQVHWNCPGDESCRPWHSKILPTETHNFIAFCRRLHTLSNILVFCSTTSEAFRSARKSFS